MHSAKVEDKMIVAGPDTPNVTQCSACGPLSHNKCWGRYDGFSNRCQ
jgi:hypothetical protein